MKKLKIGKKSYRVIENAEELSVKRFTHIKEYFILKDMGIDMPTMVKAVQGFLTGFDKGKPSHMVIELNNWLTGLKNAQDRKDFDQIIFGMIVLDEEEDPVKDISEGEILSKLQKWNNDGLTQGKVIEVVENFITSSLHPLISYFQKSSETQRGQA